MHNPVLATQDRSNMMSLLAAMGDYATAFPVSGESALETARHCLIDALTRGFEALRDPQCAALIGPIVPGAVMPGGARVPGTSLELEPAQAAFCISVMLCRPAGGEQWPAPGGARAADSLGAILAAGDYQARKAVMEGKPPPSVRDVLAALLKALEIQGVLAACDESYYAAGESPQRIARIAATAVTGAQLGATPGQIVRAVGYACIDGGMYLHRDERFTIGRQDWALADTMSRAVRHACQAMVANTSSILTSADLEVLSLAGRVLVVAHPMPREPFGTAHIDRLAGLQQPQDAARLAERFRAAVDRRFPVRQAERVKALFAAPERLDDLPINELIAALVTNGAR